MYFADQIMFFIALAGYLIMLLGLWKSKAAGDSTFGKISLGIFIPSRVEYPAALRRKKKVITDL
jgi:hypothetical protein